jgi:hypothetical protein
MVVYIRVGSRAIDQWDARVPCWKVKSGMNSLGNQAAARKYRQPSTGAGAWNGSIISTSTPSPPQVNPLQRSGRPSPLD